MTTTEIILNGLTHEDDKPRGIEELLAMLAKWRLNTLFLYKIIRPRTDGRTLFEGNFWRYNHPFRIITGDHETIRVLTEAIKANAEIKYDPVNAFWLACVRKGHPQAGRWENMHDGTFQEVRNNNRTGQTMTTEEMQQLADSGLADCY